MFYWNELSIRIRLMIKHICIYIQNLPIQLREFCFCRHHYEIPKKLLATINWKMVRKVRLKLQLKLWCSIYSRILWISLHITIDLHKTCCAHFIKFMVNSLVRYWLVLICSAHHVDQHVYEPSEVIHMFKFRIDTRWNQCFRILKMMYRRYRTAIDWNRGKKSLLI